MVQPHAAVPVLIRKPRRIFSVVLIYFQLSLFSTDIHISCCQLLVNHARSLIPALPSTFKRGACVSQPCRGSVSFGWPLADSDCQISAWCPYWTSNKRSLSSHPPEYYNVWKTLSSLVAAEVVVMSIAGATNIGNCMHAAPCMEANGFQWQEYCWH